MNPKIKTFAIITLFFFLNKLNAQFVGYYNLRDGGVDMPHSSLFVLPNNDFYIFYYAGYKTGKWKEVDKNNIELTQIKTNKNPINVYGKFNKTSKEININVFGLAKAHSLIYFAKDTISKKEYQPIFNEYPNCLDEKYKIKKKIGECNFFSITTYNSSRIGSSDIKYPYKTLSYTYSLDKKYNDYVIFQEDEDLLENINLNLNKKEDIYSIDNGKKLEREELTDAELKKIFAAKNSIDKENSKAKFGTEILYKSSNKITVFKPLLKPIFTAKCNDEEIENDTKEDNMQFLTIADRPNGIYEVVNFTEGEYDTKKYQLAKSSSISQDDILSVNKIVSDYGGGYVIELVFTEKGSKKFEELSQKNIRKPIAIVINKLIVSSPIFTSSITSGKANIGGGMSESEIDEIIKSLKKIIPKD